MNSLEIQDKKAQLKKRANEMTEICRREIRMFTEEENTEFENIKNEIKSLNRQMRELEQSLNNTEEEKREIKQNNIEKSNKMEKRFSLISAINAIANNQLVDDTTMAVINKGKEQMRASGLAMSGQIQMPTEELRSVTVSAEGEDIVATSLMDILGPLRARNVLIKAGAKVLTGLTNNVQYPIMSSGNVGWAGEVEQAGEKGDTFTHKTLTPKRLTAYIDISKMLLAQNSIGIEEAIRADLIAAINAKLEETILGDGDGLNTAGDATIAPKGIFNGATVTASCNTMEKIAGLEAAIEAANVLGECRYVVAPTTKAALRTKAKGENIATSLYANNEIDGTPCLSTGYVKANHLIYGDFSNLAIGFWSGVDLVVDMTSRAIFGEIRLVANLYVDCVVLRPEAFVFGKTTA